MNPIFFSSQYRVLTSNTAFGMSLLSSTNFNLISTDYLQVIKRSTSLTSYETVLVLNN